MRTKKDRNYKGAQTHTANQSFFEAIEIDGDALMELTDDLWKYCTRNIEPEAVNSTDSGPQWERVELMFFTLCYQRRIAVIDVIDFIINYIKGGKKQIESLFFIYKGLGDFGGVIVD